MASVEQRETQSSGLATFSNTLEIFDTFKSAREDEKDSDEESFHLPMLDCDEESDTNNKDAPAADGQSDETEDEILNKFDTDAVDNKLEENVLHETTEISESSEIVKDIDNVESEMNSFNEPPQGFTEAPAGEKPEEVAVPTETTGNNHYGENTEAMKDEETIVDDKIESETTQEEEEEEKPSEELENNDVEEVEDVEEVKEVDGVQLQTEESAINSGNVDLDENKQTDEEQKVVDEEMKLPENDEVMDVDDVDNKEESVKEVVNKIEEFVNDDVDNVNDDVDTGVDNVNDDVDTGVDKVNDENTEMDVVNVIDNVEGDAVVDTVEESVSVSDKVENVAVSIEPDAIKPKEAAAAAAAADDDNLQCEDLLDISVIRDVDEDNASAIAENLNSNDVPSSEKSDNDDPDYEKVDDDSEMDQEDEKDNIEFEESNSSNFGDQDIVELSVAEDSLRDDGDSAPKAPPEKPVVDEAKATDDGGNAVAKIVDSECTSESNSDANRIDKASTENYLKSQEEAIQNKRPLSTDVDDDLEVSPKKMRLSSSPVSEQPAVANKDDKIKTLVTFKDYMKTKKVSTKLTRSDLEQFCLQKICEAIIHKTDVGELHQTIKKQEQIIDGLRKDLQQLTKQTRDLDIVNKKLMTELRVQNGNKKPLVPLKITRSVGLQVKLNLGSETNVRRKQLIANTPNSPKVTTPTTPANRPRSITPANSSVVRQTGSAQTPKEEPSISKVRDSKEIKEEPFSSIVSNLKEIFVNNENNSQHLNDTTTKDRIHNDLEREISRIMFMDNDHLYAKTTTVKERATICPICFKDVISHFSRHLFRHHPDHKDVRLLKSMQPRSDERLALLAMFRKLGNFHLNAEKNILHPVRSSKNPDAEYFVCTYCLGHYTKKRLYKHVKSCKNRPEGDVNPGKNCLAQSQTFMALVNVKNHEFLKSSRIRNEVFSIMRADNISATAKNDSLICLYGEALLAKHKRAQVATVISNKLRELSRLLLALRSACPNVNTMFDALKPDLFPHIVNATKIISGYDDNAKTFKTPSFPLHMGTNLKSVCDVAYELVFTNRNIPNITWDDPEEKMLEIKDLKTLLEEQWCHEVKTPNETNWQRSLPLTSDIRLFHQYISQVANDAYRNLMAGADVEKYYQKLLESVFTQTVIFNHKCVEDVRHLKVETYNESVDQDDFTGLLSEAEKIISKNYKMVVVDEAPTPIPILFSKETQTHLSCLLQLRQERNLVPPSNPYLFATADSENSCVIASSVIGELAESCGANNPELLTSSRFKHHVATIFQLLGMDGDEIERIDAIAGHAHKKDSEFNSLSADINEAAELGELLILLGHEVSDKTDVYGNVDEIVNNATNDEMSLAEQLLDKMEFVNERIENPIGIRELNNTSSTKEVRTTDIEQKLEVAPQIVATKQPKQNIEVSTNSPIQYRGRVRWSDKEKALVRRNFERHIRKKITPKKRECDEFLLLHRDVFVNKDWVRVKTFVYNTFRDK